MMEENELRSQARFVEALFGNFIHSLYNNFENIDNHYSNYMNKNHGKTALKRKITLIRQELLNLEQMIESE